MRLGLLHPSLRGYGDRFSSLTLSNVLTESTWSVTTGLGTLNPNVWKPVSLPNDHGSDDR